MSRRVRIGMATPVAIAVILVAGCRAEAAPAEPIVPSIAAINDPSQLTLPLDAFANSRETDLTVQRAARLLEQRCVERFAVPYTKGNVPVESGILPVVNEGRYFLFDAEAAAVHGYGRPPGDALSEDPVRWHPSSEEYQVVTGQTEDGARSSILDRQGRPVPDGGCGSEADRILLSGAQGFDPMYVQNLQLEAYGSGLDDSRSRAAAEQWSQCMAESGYDYPDPAAANDDSSLRPEDVDGLLEAEASPEEIAVATADVACKERVNYVGVRFAVETAYQQLIIEREALRLQEHKDALDTMVRNAAAQLAGTDGSSLAP